MSCHSTLENVAGELSVCLDKWKCMCQLEFRLACSKLCILLPLVRVIIYILVRLFFMFNFLNFCDMYHQFKCLVRWITNYLFDSVNNFELWPPHLQ